MLDHISIQCADVPASAAFYDAVLAPLGGGRVMDFGDVIGYGIGSKPDFWIGPQNTGEGFRESHIAFVARDRETVRAFFEALYEDHAFGTRRMQDAFLVRCDQRSEFQLVIGFATRAASGFHCVRIVHSAAGSKVVPVSLNRLNAAHYSPAELEWVENLARSLSS